MEAQTHSGAENVPLSMFFRVSDPNELNLIRLRTRGLRYWKCRVSVGPQKDRSPNVCVRCGDTCWEEVVEVHAG